MKNIIYSGLIIIMLAHLVTAQIFVATNGNDNGSGNIDQPYASFEKAIDMAQAGDTIFVRGGIYDLTTTITISATKNGTADKMFIMSAYGDEQPVLDFTGQASGKKGIRLIANYWHIKGLQIRNAGDNGMEINFGSYNIIEQCQFYRNRDTGLQLSYGAAYNKIINCDSYYNADPPDYGDADGFAPKLTVGTGNYFYGCRAWGNCDDGWDGYLRGADDVSTTLENCWTWGNGYLENGTDPGSQANGNGFKMGGGDNSNADMLMHHFTLINCVAFDNKAKGFDQNNNAGSMTLYNCTGYNNQTANYRVQRDLADGQTLTVKNCLSYNGLSQLGSFAIQEENSWLAPFDVTADDFVNLLNDSASAKRQADGALPEIDFLHLAEGSDLIDGGVDLGYPYFGDAPDLGAFESDYTTSIIAGIIPQKFTVYPNYPNPFNPQTVIAFTLKSGQNISLGVYDINGKKIADLLHNAPMSIGRHEIIFDGSSLTSGTYIYRLVSKNQSVSGKMLLLK